MGAVGLRAARVMRISSDEISTVRSRQWKQMKLSGITVYLKSHKGIYWRIDNQKKAPQHL
jgi:hypothetical protein